MGLSVKNTLKAIQILETIAGKSLSLFPYEEETKFKTDVILGADRKFDGSYESICMNFKDIPSEVLEEFEVRRFDVANSSYIKTEWEENKNETRGLIQIGCF
jgi:hypothetical protein